MLCLQYKCKAKVWRGWMGVMEERQTMYADFPDSQEAGPVKGWGSAGLSVLICGSNMVVVTRR